MKYKVITSELLASIDNNIYRFFNISCLYACKSVHLYLNIKRKTK